MNFNNKLNVKFQKVNLILNIFLEKQFFFFIYIYLFFIKRVFIIFTTNIFFTVFKDLLLNFCNRFHFSLLLNNVKHLNRISFINQFKFLLFTYIIKKKKFLLKSKFLVNFVNKNLTKIKSKFKICKINNRLYKKLPILKLEDFYFKRYIKFGKKIHISFDLNKRNNHSLFKKFRNFSFTMIRIFKLKLIFSIFFRLNIQFEKKLKFFSFLSLNRFPLSITASKIFFIKVLKCTKYIRYFSAKYKEKIKFITTISNLTSRSLNLGNILKGGNYFLSKIVDKFYISKKMYILSTGRSMLYRFSTKLGIFLPFKYTKYKKIKKNHIKFYSNMILNKNLFKNLKYKFYSKFIDMSEYKKNLKSKFYYIKKPLQRLIISGRKKAGYNIFNNVFLSLSKLYKRPLLNHIEIVNNVYKKLFIRATIRNVVRNKSALGVRQSCSLLMGFEELKSRVNLFFFDYMHSLCKKKNKILRVRKIKDLVFSDFFKFSLLKNEKKQSTHLAVVFSDIYAAMFTELKFRGAFKQLPFRTRLFEISKKKHKFIRPKNKFIKFIFKMRLKRKKRNFKKFDVPRMKLLKTLSKKMKKIYLHFFNSKKLTEKFLIKYFYLKKKIKYYYMLIKKRRLYEFRLYFLKLKRRKILNILEKKKVYHYRNTKVNNEYIEKGNKVFLLRKIIQILNKKTNKKNYKYIIRSMQKYIAVFKYMFIGHDFKNISNIKLYKFIEYFIKKQKKDKSIDYLKKTIKFLKNKFKLVKDFRLRRIKKKYIKFALKKLSFHKKMKKKNEIHLIKSLIVKPALKRINKRILFHRLKNNLNIKLKKKKKLNSKRRFLLKQMKKPAKFLFRENFRFLVKLLNNRFNTLLKKKAKKRYFSKYKMVKLINRYKKNMELLFKNIYEKNLDINCITKNLKMKTISYSADILTKSFLYSTSNKSSFFIYKVKQFLNKFFINERSFNIVYPKNKSIIEILKISHRLGNTCSNYAIRSRNLFKNSLISRKIKTQYKKKNLLLKSIYKYLKLKRNIIKKLKNVYYKLKKKQPKFYNKSINIILKKHKFLRFVFIKKINKKKLNNFFNIYYNYLKKKNNKKNFLTKDLKVILNTVIDNVKKIIFRYRIPIDTVLIKKQ